MNTIQTLRDESGVTLGQKIHDTIIIGLYKKGYSFDSSDHLNDFIKQHGNVIRKPNGEEEYQIDGVSFLIVHPLESKSFINNIGSYTINIERKYQFI